jgi:hypothetical protein
MSSKLRKIDFTSMPRSAKYLNSCGSASNLARSEIFKKDENSVLTDIYRESRIICCLRFFKLIFKYN